MVETGREEEAVRGLFAAGSFLVETGREEEEEEEEEKVESAADVVAAAAAKLSRVLCTALSVRVPLRLMP